MNGILGIMGSGELAPTMVTTHQRLVERSGGPAVLLDTPFGFQENVDQLSDRAREYFRRSVGTELVVARWRTDEPAVERDRALALIDGAGYVFAGPGSPTYALDRWRGSGLRDVLLRRLASGGAITFASAAALTLGRLTVPVYEIYKVGAEPAWAEGLDLMSELGLDVAVIPHFDNAEGGNHDTRFCYLGERRLARLERQLLPGTFVIGVDEHTGLLLDLAAGTAEVVGKGGVTVRRDGTSRTIASGSKVAIDELATAGQSGPAHHGSAGGADATGGPAPGAPSVLDEANRLEDRFGSALADARPDDAVTAVLELGASLDEWAADPTQSDLTDRARAVQRRMIVRLGEAARAGTRDPVEVIGPFVEAALAARSAARDAGRYEAADAVRDHLVDAGIEIQDGPEGTTWSLSGTD